MTDVMIYNIVINGLDLTPYRMLDTDERVSVINSAYSEAYITYQIGIEPFVTYAQRQIKQRLEEAKKLHYRLIRVESPFAVYSESYFQKEHPMNLESHVVMRDFLSFLPKELRMIALCYMDNLTYTDVCELFNISIEDLKHYNAIIARLWLEYNR